jgi:hypothetical protein
VFTSPPNITDYSTFVYSQLPKVTPALLPTDSPFLATSLKIAQDIVNPKICIASSGIYVLAVYNLALDRLVNYQPDVSGQSYFADLRGQKGYGINSLTVGVPAAASDNGTAVGILNPEQMKNLTFADLQNMKTPWGRAYMGIAMSVGTLWGLT